MQQLNLRNNLVKDEGAAVLSNFLKHDENKVLKFLDLSLCSITHVGAKAIGEMLVDNTALLELRLKDNRIGSIGAASIAQGLRDNCCLETLSLKGNTICDPGCVPFAEISFGNLISLDLRANYIGNMGCKHLADGLKDNESIRRLSLRENNFTKEGKWAFGEVLRKKKLAFWASERDAKVYYGADYVPKSDLEKSFIIPEIDFDNIRGIRPKGLLPTYIAYECCDCCCDVPIKNCCGRIKRETGCSIS